LNDICARSTMPNSIVKGGKFLYPCFRAITLWFIFSFSVLSLLGLEYTSEQDSSKSIHAESMFGFTLSGLK